MSYGTVLIALSYFILNIPYANGLAIAVTCTLFITLGEIIGMPFMNSYYIARSNSANRGQYAALFTMAWSTAQVIGSLSGTQIAYAWGFDTLWWFIGGLCLVTALGFRYLLNKS